LGVLSKGIRNTLRFVAGFYLLMNLCVATIPRCDNILAVLQHSLITKAPEAPACHDTTPATTGTAISNKRLCECTLVKFVFVTLPNFDPQSLIGFRIHSSTLIQFEIALWNPAALKGPEPPYPRRTLV